MSKAHEELLRIARKRFDAISAAESHIRVEALEDLKFVYNLEDGQWPEALRRERAQEGRPCLTSNKLRKFVSVVANQATLTRPALGVVPVDDISDPQTAKVYEGIIRNIEYQSEANAIYQRALEHSVACGFGYWRILTRYADDGFDQEIYLEAVHNPFSAYLDPDGRYGFVRARLSKEEFEEKYPNAEPVNVDLGSYGEQYTTWYDTDTLYVAEYFWKEPVTKQIAQVLAPDGQTRIVEVPLNGGLKELLNQGFQVLRDRTVSTHTVKWATLTGKDVLAQQDWPGSDIPIIEICGDKQYLGEKLYKRSLIRDARDPQRMYNFWLTAQTEGVALVPKAPFLMTPEMVKGHEAMWNEANRRNRPYLLYNSVGGQKPGRERPPDVQPGAMTMMNIADKDIKDVIGIFEPGLGDVSNERSGRAIKMRQDRSDLGTGHFHEQFRHALIRTGKQLIELIPHVYDTARMIRIRGEDGVSTPTPINYPMTDVDTGEPTLLHDLSAGKFDIEANIRVYQTRREEATEMMVQALQYAPSVAPYILDLIFKYADWPGAEEIASRLQALMASQQVPPAFPGAAPNQSAAGPPQGGTHG